MGRMRATLMRGATGLLQKLDRRRWRIAVTVEHADEVPERIPRRRAVLVGTPSAVKWLVFDCPCAERHRVMLNLDRGRRPTWAVGPEKIVTISPSVDALSARGRCHYFIRSGRVQWIK
jgi:Family of unknown function (DUF6527)